MNEFFLISSTGTKLNPVPSQFFGIKVPRGTFVERFCIANVCLRDVEFYSNVFRSNSLFPHPSPEGDESSPPPPSLTPLLRICRPFRQFGRRVARVGQVGGESG